MVRERPRKPVEICSFCGTHKDEVPYLMSSQVADAGICTHCVFGMSIENVRWASGVFNAVKAEHRRQKDADSTIIRPDTSTVDAINKARGKMNGDRSD